MILAYKCVVCDDVHKIVLNQAMLDQQHFKTICPSTGRVIIGTIMLKLDAIPDVSKLDYKVAEDEARAENAKWYFDEAVALMEEKENEKGE